MMIQTKDLRILVISSRFIQLFNLIGITIQLRLFIYQKFYLEHIPNIPINFFNFKHFKYNQFILLQSHLFFLNQNRLMFAEKYKNELQGFSVKTI